MISVKEAMRREHLKMGQQITLIEWVKMPTQKLVMVVYRVNADPNYKRMAVYQDKACHMSVVLD